MNGHRIYAAIPWLVVDTDWVAFLDDDNWFQPTHIQGMLDAVAQSTCPSKVTWAHSLRTIYNDDGTQVADDKCESLGLLHECWDRPEHFCDTSTLMIRRKLACQLCSLWESLTPDRGLSACLIKDHVGVTSSNHTLSQRVAATL